jgi:esterase/lipase superfamily enzyme
MRKESHKVYSTNLKEEVEITLHGHFGFTILLFPTYTDSPNENETEGLIDSVSHFIKKGKCKVFTVNGGMIRSWFNENLSPLERSKELFNYNNFLIDELVPIIFGTTGGPSPIITAGANLGAFTAANTYFRRPDLFYGTIALSGTFNMQHYSKEYFDENCYYNSPIHYLPNLNESYWLSYLQSKHHVYLMSGSGDNEFPQNSVILSDVLNNKGIPHHLDIWGPEYGHNFDTWKLMLNHILETKL